MPDIQLRFHKDMLVLSAPIDAAIEQQGGDAARDRQYLNLIEPDSVLDALRLEAMAGAQCIVTTTEDITQARLAHLRMDADAQLLAKAALSVANEVKPQHVLVEIGPCGLPLDSSSKASLDENRKQYARAAQAFEDGRFDAFFLNGFSSIPDLKCALMGVAQMSGKPVFASVSIDGPQRQRMRERLALSRSRRDREQPDSPAEVEALFGACTPIDESRPAYVPDFRQSSLPAEQWPEALETMVDLGAAVVGFETAEPIDQALALARIAARQSSRPILAQLCITETAVDAVAKNLVPLEDIVEYTPDTMTAAAAKLYGEGVQFLRATGSASASYTGALAAAVGGLDVRQR